MTIEVKQIGRVGYRIPVNGKRFIRGISDQTWGKYNGSTGGAPDVNLREFYIKQSGTTPY